MSRKVRVSVIANSGLDKVPSNFESMLNYLRDEVEQVLPDKPDLIVFPEACDRCIPFSEDQQKAWYIFRGNRIRDFFSQIARENRCYIAYSAIRYFSTEVEHPFRNSTQIIGRDGVVVGIYDKNHLVPYEFDEREVAYGTEAEVIELDFGRVACIICFDLNFNSLLERYASQKPDLVVFSSFYHGGIKQLEWASRCRSYFVGAIDHDQSRIIDAFGNEIASTTNYQDFVTASINLDLALVHLDRNREKINAAKKKYGPLLQVFDPGRYGSVRLSYEGTDRTVMDIVQEFDILLLDEYLALCLEHRELYS